jgi:hypothetical protein
MTLLGAQWRDFSDFVVHFTKDTSSSTAYANMVSICWERCLRAGNAFGVARQKAPASAPQEAVCFSEIPLHELGRLAVRRSSYGIGFSKEFISRKGGCPVWYLPKDSPAADAIQNVMSNALRQPAPASEPIWSITPCIDFPGDYPTGRYRFEWEREWRLPGSLQFRESDVAFLVIPEVSHHAARTFFEGHIREGTGPGYVCPYIDPFWDWERVQKAFSGG